MTSNIPHKVLQLAKPLLDTKYGEIKYIGVYKGLEIYLMFPFEDVDTGFPIVFSYDVAKDEAMYIEALEALRISGQLLGD